MSEAAPAARRFGAFIPVAGFAALATLLYLALFWGDPSEIGTALKDKPVPEFVLPPVEGLQSIPGFETDDLKTGVPTIVNVWASWCVPCRAEHPILMQLAERDDVRLVGLNYKDAPENARRFLGTLGNPFQAVGADRTGWTAIDWGVYGVPETFIVDGEGLIRFKHVGPIVPADIENVILPALKNARSPVSGALN
ncbi:MAG: DsbE family thiol:disulfide interchange protein [Candidatus Phaeomarinobacter sp.]